jgi:hypothetical protein
MSDAGAEAVGGLPPAFAVTRAVFHLSMGS